MRNFVLLICGITLFTMQACKEQPGVMMSYVSGNAGEVLVVVEKHKWESAVGDSVFQMLTVPVVGLPQEEPMYKVTTVPKAAFSKIFRSHRNIIRINISGNNDKTGLFIDKDVFAKTQIVISFNCSNDEEFFKLFEKNKDLVMNALYEAELDRIVATYLKFQSTGISVPLKEKHGIVMNFPTGYVLNPNTDDFSWISHETNFLSQAVCIFKKEYRDTSDFSKDNIILWLNEAMKENVPGPSDGSYMTLELSFPIQHKVLLRNGLYTVEMRGLWRVENDFMGGPFVSITMVDENTNNILTAFGYVYAGKHDKRIYMRQVEGLLQTIRFVDEKVALNAEN